jgi:hypothetical protein
MSTKRSINIKDISHFIDPVTGNKRNIKNAQKYIDQLYKDKEHFRNRFVEQQGELIATWTPHENKQETVSSTVLLKFSKGDIIIIEGEVLSAKGLKCRFGNKESSVTYTVKRTLRRQAK